MKCAYDRCSCTPDSCEGKRRKAPLKPWGKFCCRPCADRSRMALTFGSSGLVSIKIFVVPVVIFAEPHT